MTGTAMDRRAYLKQALWLGGGVVLPAGIAALLGRQSISYTPDLTSFSGKIMGTRYSVKLGDATPKSAAEFDQNTLSVEHNKVLALAKGAYRVLQAVDHTMSTWRSDSELSQFNRSADTDWQAFSPATFEVIKKAQQTSQLSAGAFDISVSPLIDLWGFGAGANQHPSNFANVPSARAIAKTLNGVGYHFIDLDSDKRAISKQNEHTQLDLSGIAKGYAVDLLADFLDQQGMEHYLVEVGGELRSFGHKPNGTAWRVAIERPQIGQPDVLRVVLPGNNGIATSGDYRHFFMRDAQRYSHSIDPRTGYAITHELASVCVIAPTTMEADALSTALMVMGPDQAMSLVAEQGIAAHFILRSANGNFAEQFSKRFENHLV